MNKIWAMAIKDLRIAMRDKAGTFWRFAFPLIMAVFFGSIFGGVGSNPVQGISLAVVDEDQTPQSRAFIKLMHDGEEIRVMSKADDRPFERDEARDLVRRGRLAAYLIIPEGFGEAMRNPFSPNGIELELGTDPARSAESAMLEGILTGYSFRSLVDTFSSTDSVRDMVREGLEEVRNAEDMPLQARLVFLPFMEALDQFVGSEAFESDILGGLTADAAGADGDASSAGLTDFAPVTFRKSSVVIERSGPRSAYDVSFPQGFIWALIGTAASFSIALVAERRRGTLVRLRMAPITRSHILAGKALSCFVTVLANVAILALIGAVVFGVTPHSIPLFVLAIFSAGICFVGLMMLLSVLGRTEEAVGGIGWAVLLGMAMIGGGMIPLVFMPSWLQVVSKASPVSWTVLAIEGAMWRGFSIAEMALPCGILIAVGVVSFAAGARVFRSMPDS